MPSIQSRFKHEEGNDLNGVLRYLYDIYGKEEYFRKINIKTSTERGNYIATNAIDFNNSTHWTQLNDDLERYIIIKLPFRFFLEGYTIQTSNGWYHLKTWLISASNNGSTFTEEHKEEDVDNKLQNGTSAAYYHFHSFFEPYQYFRIRYDSIYHDTKTRFDLNQVEFYGCIPSYSCKSNNNLSLSSFLCLIFLLRI